MKNSVKVGIIQVPPVYLNLAASMEKAGKLIQEAAKNGANLIVFGETWLTGYPSWLDYAPKVATWDYQPTKEIFTKMYKNSLEVPSKEFEQLANWAKKYHVTICIGINEKKTKGAGNGTIFNSLLIINGSGELSNHHRKLMPTYTEKLLYGMGDGHGLKSIETEFGRVGGLICWEHWMPLVRQSMHDEGELIHVALWPAVHEIHQLASRHYAFEGRCFVIAVGQILRAKDIPENIDLPAPFSEDPEAFLLNGGSCIIGPDGQFLLEPQFEKEEIIYFEIENLERAIHEKITLDVTGHYQRPDVFDVNINRRRLF